MTMMMTLLDAIWDHIRWSRSMWICLLLLKQTDWVSPTTHRLPNKAMSFYFFVCSTRLHWFPPKQKLATQWASEVGLPQTPPERSKTRTTRKCPCMAYTIHAPALKCFDPWTRSDLRQTRKRMSRRKAAKKGCRLSWTSRRIDRVTAWYGWLYFKSNVFILSISSNWPQTPI